MPGRKGGRGPPGEIGHSINGADAWKFKGEQGEPGLVGPPGQDATVPIKPPAVTLVFQGDEGEQGDPGIPGHYGRPGNKGWEGDRVRFP